MPAGRRLWRRTRRSRPSGRSRPRRACRRRRSRRRAPWRRPTSSRAKCAGDASTQDAEAAAERTVDLDPVRAHAVCSPLLWMGRRRAHRRGGHEGAPRRRGGDRGYGADVEPEDPWPARVGARGDAVHGRRAEDAVGGPVQPPPVLRPDPLPQRERDVDQDHQLRREDPEGRPHRPVGDEPGDEQPGDAHVHRRVQYQRDRVAGEGAEPEHREHPVQVGDGGGLQRAERPRLQQEAGEHRQRQHARRR